MERFVHEPQGNVEVQKFIILTASWATKDSLYTGIKDHVFINSVTNSVGIEVLRIQSQIYLPSCSLYYGGESRNERCRQIDKVNFGTSKHQENYSGAFVFLPSSPSIILHLGRTERARSMTKDLILWKFFSSLQQWNKEAIQLGLPPKRLSGVPRERTQDHIEASKFKISAKEKQSAKKIKQELPESETMCPVTQVRSAENIYKGRHA